MAVTITSSAITSSSAISNITTWLFQFTSDLGGTPTFYIYVDGYLEETTTRGNKVVQVPFDREFQIEILDDVDAVPAEAFPDWCRISWDPVDGAENYRIDQWDGVDTWNEIAVVRDLGQNTFTFDTPKLDDVTAHQFRMTPINQAGIEGLDRIFNVFMVRRPDRPDVTYVYDDGTAKITATVA